MRTSSRHHCTQDAIVIGLSIITLAAVGGCGMTIAEAPAATSGVARTVELAATGPESAVVVLDFESGNSALYPNNEMAPIDLTKFTMDDGRTLADRKDEFIEEVRSRIELILEDVNEIDLSVVLAAEDGEAVETTILITQALSPNGRIEIGRADYDPCNKHYNDEAVIFGEQIHRLGDGYSFEEWVLMFSNVCAHETCHTIGYGHISRKDNPPTERAVYVELMLDGFTMAEMRRPHRLLFDQDSCPNEDVERGTLAGDITTDGSRIRRNR